MDTYEQVKSRFIELINERCFDIHEGNVKNIRHDLYSILRSEGMSRHKKNDHWTALFKNRLYIKTGLGDEVFLLIDNSITLTTLEITYILCYNGSIYRKSR